ncbi:MAG: hypothetical protein ACOCYV_01765 [Planctomycetota bacterium]
MIAGQRHHRLGARGPECGQSCGQRREAWVVRIVAEVWIEGEQSQPGPGLLRGHRSAGIDGEDRRAQRRGTPRIDDQACRLRDPRRSTTDQEHAQKREHAAHGYECAPTGPETKTQRASPDPS